jgi:hypothetical protein
MTSLKSKRLVTMQKLPVGTLLSFIQGGRGFLLGLLTGAMLAVTGTAFSESKEAKQSPSLSVIYTLSELAINTETNAASIAALRARVDDLELKIDEIGGKKK